MKIDLGEIAKNLIDNDFKSSDIDSKSLEISLIEFLDENYDIFNELREEMERIEDDNRLQPRNKSDYDELIGEV